jgi:D-threo-aldose 1-dehydrogenase
MRDWTSRAGKQLSFSALGFGAAPLGDMHRRLREDEAIETVERAWALGLRYFDTAPLYGHGLSERRLGEALRVKVRDSYLLSTKVGRLLEPCLPGAENSGIYVNPSRLRVRFDYSYDGIMRSYEASRGRLGLDRIDILYVHDIDPVTHGSEAGSDARFIELIDGGGWRAFDDLRVAGDVTAIGAGLNHCGAAERVLEVADPDLFLLAGRYTVLEQAALDSFFPACLANGVGVVIGGAFNSGILATGAVAGAQYDYAPASSAVLARVREIEAVCRRHGVPLPQAALAFPLAHPAVVSLLMGAQTRAEVDRNAELFGGAIPPQLWSDLIQAGLVRLDAPLPTEAHRC